MNYKPTTVHIAAMVDELDEGPMRAVYMVVKQLHEMQKALKKEYHETKIFSTGFCKFWKGVGNMCKEQMIDQIFEMVRNADDATLESFYWFLIMELET